MMKVLHVFTEEPSAKNVFEIILPKILPENVNFRVYPHQGKNDLEKALKKPLPINSKSTGAKVLITRDQDTADCLELKNRIKDIVGKNCHCDYYIQIICKELESWFLGDIMAINKGYPRFKPESFKNKSDFRNVDKITNPNIYLLKIIPEFSKRSTLPKLEVSETIAPFLNISDNKSVSFIHTINAIKKLINS